MKLKASSIDLEYSLKDNISQILLDFISLTLLIIFAYNLYIGKISLNNVLNMSIVLLIIFFFRLLKKLMVYLLVNYIETLNSHQKLRIFLFTHRLWLVSNPLLYFMASNIEFEVKIRRILSTKPNSWRLLYKLVLFLFYYPLTRLLYFHRRLMDKILLENEDKLVFSRIEGYVIVWLFFFPFIFHGVFDILYLICIYLFVLVFLFPILNLLKHLLAKLLIIVLSKFRNKKGDEKNVISKLIRMSADQTISSFISLSGSGVSYPTINWLVIQRGRSEKNLFGTIATLYFNDHWRCYYDNDMHKVYYFTSVGFTCGTDSKRALIWWLYYKKLIISQQIYIENNQHVSYLWYKALYDVLNDDWWDCWMIEFFIQLADQSNNKLKKEQLQQLNNIMSSHLLIMKKVFKLIWDIEKSWQIDPLSIHTQLQSRMLNKGRSYPVYDDCSYLFSNNTSLDGIKIPLNVYYQHLQKSVALKNFDYKLEDEIIRFFIDYHVDIKKRKPSTGHWSMFHEYGKYLMPDFPLCKENFYDILVIRAFETTPYEKMKFRDNEVPSALDYFYYEGFYFQPQGIRKFVLNRLGDNIAKWREEWEKTSSDDI